MMFLALMVFYVFFVVPKRDKKLDEMYGNCTQWEVDINNNPICIEYAKEN